jgi:RNA recognition motif-containing protein
MNIYVSNISFHTTEEILADMFSRYGSVKSVKIIKDEATGQHKGFGFVEMQSMDEAFEAIKVLDGKEIQGRSLRVSKAKDASNYRTSNR